MTTHDSQMAYTDWEESVTFSDHGSSPKTLIETDRLKAVLLGLRAGQAIPVHPSPEAVYHFLGGTGIMTVDNESFTVQPGPGIRVASPRPDIGSELRPGSGRSLAPRDGMGLPGPLAGSRAISHSI